MSHEVRVQSIGDSAFRAVCMTCGWLGRDLDTTTAAECDGDQHAILAGGDEAKGRPCVAWEAA